ncbi:MAG: 50S ribosomal protein L10 [Candidatus Aenigmarchaeota archaeon]|nr:50S ribosomal protein L10 [Candidatus Aenigmarchaeota archaeon]
MVSEKKKLDVIAIKQLIEKYPVVGVIDLFKMPSRQLQSIRKNLKEVALIRMCKKRMISLALKEVKGRKNIEKLGELKPKEPALIFSEMDPFKLFKTFKKNKSKGYAKPRDIAPEDITIPAGPTNLLAGPAIGELQRLKIPAMVKEGRIHVREDFLVAKKGEMISDQLANVLKKLDIQPMEIGIDILGLWEGEIVYSKDVLDVDESEYIKDIKNAYINALNLCVNTCYPNKESIKILLQKAYQNGKNLGINAKILDKGIVEGLIERASVQAQNLRRMLKI